MYKVTFWKMTSAESVVVEHFDRPMCPGDDGDNWPCPDRPHYTLAWTVNTAGLPSLGTPRYDYACTRHLAERIARIPFEHAGSVVITPYEEVKE